MTKRFCPHCGTIHPEGTEVCPRDESPLLDLRSGQDRTGSVMAGKFRLVRLLGEGGFGSVYLAENLMLGKEVAIKVVKPELAADSQMVQRFIKEARVVTRLSHPNTIATYDLYQDQESSLLIMAMEYIPGRTLKDLIKEQVRVPWQRSLGICIQICDSLEEAHGLGIIHRDLKPANIMLTDRFGRRDYVKVMDFGIAKVIEDGDDQSLTATGMFVGSPAYMSPEHIQGHDLDPRADIYSMGVILYEMLCGKLPVTAKQITALIQTKLTTKPRPLREIDNTLSVPSNLEALVLSMLGLRAGERPATVQVVRQRMAAILEQEAGIYSGTRHPTEATGTMAPGSVPAPIPRDETRSEQGTVGYLDTLASTFATGDTVTASTRETLPPAPAPAPSEAPSSRIPYWVPALASGFLLLLILVVVLQLAKSNKVEEPAKETPGIGGSPDTPADSDKAPDKLVVPTSGPELKKEAPREPEPRRREQAVEPAAPTAADAPRPADADKGEVGAEPVPAEAGRDSGKVEPDQAGAGAASGLLKPLPEDDGAKVVVEPVRQEPETREQVIEVAPAPKSEGTTAAPAEASAGEGSDSREAVVGDRASEEVVEVEAGTEVKAEAREEQAGARESVVRSGEKSSAGTARKAGMDLAKEQDVPDGKALEGEIQRQIKAHEEKLDKELEGVTDKLKSGVDPRGDKLDKALDGFDDDEEWP